MTGHRSHHQGDGEPRCSSSLTRENVATGSDDTYPVAARPWDLGPVRDALTCGDAHGAGHGPAQLSAEPAPPSGDDHGVVHLRASTAPFCSGSWARCPGMRATYRCLVEIPARRFLWITPHA